MYEVLGWESPEFGATVQRGLGAFGVPEPLSLEQWARQHFYLSKESSYVEGAWTPWPFQRAIMACISNDDIRFIDFMKSARVGYTKILLAAIGYFAEHKRRNQALWQPTDGDNDEFVKTELDPMLRDVGVMARAMPAHLARHKDNTLAQKKFLGCLLHTRGGTAARAYRRISVDVAFLDELDAFLRDIDKEGAPDILAAKRVEGATFPKMVTGSTPKLAGFSLIQDRYEAADERFKYAIPCPGCGNFHPLVWGKKDDATGMRWLPGDPDSVRHLCPHPGCGTLITQAEYLALAPQGRWQNVDGSVTIDADGVFRNALGHEIAPMEHIAFHVWTAYSPAATWSNLVDEFLSAYAKAQAGDITKLKAFTNTTLGLPWEVEMEKTDADQLKERAEPYAYGTVPLGGLLLLASCDTQDNRIEVLVRAIGRGMEVWYVDYRIFYGNPSEDQVWSDLAEYLWEATLVHAGGAPMKIHAAAIDTQGHHTHAVYSFVAAQARLGHKIYAVRGSPGVEKHIKNGVGKVDIDWRGKKVKKGLLLWHVGTNLAKDLIYGRLQITKTGPGYTHFSKDASDEFYKQMAGEARVERASAGGKESRWTPLRKRVEAWDCTVYGVWLETHLDLPKKSARFWDELEEKVAPSIVDLFAAPAPAGDPATAREVKVTPPPATPAPVSGRAVAPSPFASDGWASRGFR
ncbi:phage terminase large subunit family protein [Massilia endophytica]|uniref:phage terminase large subunit family protein n=1 Tax=Massilia endophytica TaxID=2899220 RepID=UPI001E50DBC9|nr:terminase gpA endonuclease subunit [Massilia endophytica]UGQ49262.1 phage terminase large subunit family protein [Massilia endophytica]